MKVLFCSSCNKDKDKADGGIDIWTRNIISYYNELRDSAVDLELFPFDDEAVGEQTSFCARAFYGAKKLFRKSFKLYLRLKKRDVEFVHISTSASLSLFKDILMIRIAKHYKCRTALHLHFGRIPQLYLSKNWEWKMIVKIGGIVDNIVVMDNASFSTLRNVGFDNVHYIPNPVSEKVIDIARHTPVPDRTSNQLLFVGHGYKTKGVYELVKGCRDVDNVTLRIVGLFSESIRNELLEIAKEKDNGNWITFVGELPHNKVIMEMLTSDIFVFPSYTEGFPNVILEAMASGCAIASSNVGAIPEMLDIDGDACGLCYAPKSAEAVSKAVASLISKPDIKNLMRKRAKDRVVNQYSLHSVWKLFLKIWLDSNSK